MKLLNAAMMMLLMLISTLSMVTPVTAKNEPKPKPPKESPCVPGEKECMGLGGNLMHCLDDGTWEMVICDHSHPGEITCKDNECVKLLPKPAASSSMPAKITLPIKA